MPVPHFGVVLPWQQWQELSDRLKSQAIEFVIEPYVRFEGQVGEQATLGDGLGLFGDGIDANDGVAFSDEKDRIGAQGLLAMTEPEVLGERIPVRAEIAAWLREQKK